MTDMDYIRKRVAAMYDTGKITRKPDGCHIYTGKWKHGQPEAKFDGRRQSILPYMYAARHGAMPPAAAACKRTCGTPLCVNPDHMQPMTRQTAIMRSNRTITRRTQQTLKITRIWADRNYGESDYATDKDKWYMSHDRRTTGPRNKTRGGYNG